MYGILVSFSEPPLGSKGLMSQCSVLPYVPLSGTARKHIQESQSWRLSGDVCQKLVWMCRCVSSFIHAPSPAHWLTHSSLHAFIYSI